MKPLRSLWPSFAVSLLLLPVRADEPSTEVSIELPNSAETSEGIALSARGQEFKAFRLDVWRLEHARIQSIRAARHNPTQRGMWYSSRSGEERMGRRLSDAQYPLIAGQIALLALSGRDGREAAWKGAQSVIVTGAITMAIKKTWLRRRPYPNDHKFGTFPSGHTSTSFAMAGVMGAAQPELRIPALLAASAVGWSRVKVRAHHWQDVFAGAALGLAVSTQFKPKRQRGRALANFKLRF